MSSEARRLGITPQAVQRRRKVAAGLCGRCPISRPRKAKRAGLCQEHYDDHVRRSRERMREIGGYAERKERS
jgi:hypothetical protein